MTITKAVIILNVHSIITPTNPHIRARLNSKIIYSSSGFYFKIIFYHILICVTAAICDDEESLEYFDATITPFNIQVLTNKVNISDL